MSVVVHDMRNEHSLIQRHRDTFPYRPAGNYNGKHDGPDRLTPVADSRSSLTRDRERWGDRDADPPRTIPKRDDSSNFGSHYCGLLGVLA